MLSLNRMLESISLVVKIQGKMGNNLFIHILNLCDQDDRKIITKSIRIRTKK